MASLLFYPTSDSDAWMRELAKFLATSTASGEEELKAVMTELKRLFTAGAASRAEFFDQLAQLAAAFFDGKPDEEVEGAYLYLLSGVATIADEATYLAVMNNLLETVLAAAGAGADARAPLRLKVLGTIFNAADMRGRLRLKVLLRLIAFASETRQVARLAGLFEAVETLPRRWDLTLAEERDLLLAVARALEAAGKHDDAQTFRVQYLRTFEGREVTAADLAEARPVARAAALGYIKAPVISQRSELPRLAVVQALGRHAEDARVFELLEIFAAKRLHDYLAFHRAHGAWIAEEGIDHDTSVATMRLLTLASLAAERDRVPFADIERDLQIPEEEVEGWVVRCITRGLVEGRMNQLTRDVVVSRALQREFDRPHWTQLQRTLESWRDNVGQMLSVLRAARPGSA